MEHDEEIKFRSELNLMGPKEVRLKLAGWGEDRVKVAKDWLQVQESNQVALANAASLEETRSSNRIAREANALASEANALAVKANELAASAEAKASKAATRATISNIIAAVALAASIITTLAQYHWTTTK